jgi:hypothetical protein
MTLTFLITPRCMRGLMDYHVKVYDATITIHTTWRDKRLDVRNLVNNRRLILQY